MSWALRLWVKPSVNVEAAPEETRAISAIREIRSFNGFTSHRDCRKQSVSGPRESENPLSIRSRDFPFR